MYYAVTFVKGTTTKNSWTDWHMVPSSRPVINPPEPKKTIIEIPGSNGVIDLTESLTGDVTYGNRTGSIEFIVMNDKPMAWYELYNEIMNTIHGRLCQISLEEEPDWYYEGRLEVNEWRSDPDYSRITIDYDLDPFKYKKTAVSDKFTVSSTVTKTYTNSRKPVVPTFNVASGSNNLKVTFKGVEHSLTTGSQAVAGIVFEEGNNTLKFTGTGTVTVIYREGKL